MALNLDWEKRSDLVHAPENRKTPRVLEEHELAEAEVELTHPTALEWLKRHKTSSTLFTNEPWTNRENGSEGPKEV